MLPSGLSAVFLAGLLPRLLLRLLSVFEAVTFTVFLTSLALSVYTVPSSNWMSYSLSSERTYVTLDLKNKAVPEKKKKYKLCNCVETINRYILCKKVLKFMIMDYRMGFKQMKHLFYRQVNLFSSILIYF